MEQNIFKIFTKDNGIILTKESIKIIKENVSSDDDIKKIVRFYLIEFGNTRVDLKALEELIQKNKGYKKKVDFEVKNIYYKPLRERERYKIMKGKINCGVSQISSLKNESSSIFGCLYKDILGKYTLEDDTGTIEVDTSKLLGDVFLFEYMYVGFHGLKKNNKFNAVSAFLPQISATVFDHSRVEARKFTKIFFFHGYLTEETLETVVLHKESTIVVFIGPFCDGKNSFLHFIKNVDYNIILIPNIVDFLMEEGDFHCNIVPSASFLEEKKDLDNVYRSNFSNKSVMNSTNPCFLYIYGLKIFISSIQLFNYKKNGDFFGKNYFKSFIRSYVSQYDVNPFSPPHVHYDSIPNVYVICQEHMQFEEVLDDIRFVSLPKFNEDSVFLEYDLETFETNLRQHELNRESKNHL